MRRGILYSRQGPAQIVQFYTWALILESHKTGMQLSQPIKKVLIFEYPSTQFTF